MSSKPIIQGFEVRRPLRVGFVLSETVDERFVPWESFLDWESYIDLYCLALMRRGHTPVKYVPSIDVETTKSYRHKFGHVVKRVPVHHPLFNPRWISRKRMGRAALSRTAHQLQGISFTLRLLKEARADLVEILHYSSYYSSFFVPSFLAKAVDPVIAQYSGGALPNATVPRVFWRAILAPSLASSSAILIGDYESELRSLHSQAGANPHKVRNFDSPVVDTTVFRPVRREEALAKSGFDGDRLNILSVTFIPRRHNDPLAKNPFLLVSLLARLNPLMDRRVVLYFAGFGPGMDELEHQAQSEGVSSQVRLLGRVQHDSLPYMYSASDLVFVPFSFEKLNEGSVTFEAFACGTLVAGWRRTKQTPTEQPGGFLVDMEPASAAEQLSSRLQDAEYVARKKVECASLAAQVSLETTGNKLDRYYREAIKKSRGKSPIQ